MLGLFLIFPLVVFADEPKVLTLETSVEGTTVNYSGTMESGSHAVMCKLYDSTDKLVNMKSVAVNESAFEGTFVVQSVGEYTVSCANYDGGKIKGASANVETALPSTVKIEFNTNGGDSMEDIEVARGTTVQEPQRPTKEGWDFGGWYADQTLTTPFNFPVDLTENALVYVKWVEPTYVIHTIFLNESGSYQIDFAAIDELNTGILGEPVNSSQVYNIPVGEEMILSANPVDGMHVKGWFITHEYDTDGHGTMGWAEDQLLSDSTSYRYTPEGDMYLLLVFEEGEPEVGPEEPETHTIRFNTNGGEAMQDMVVPHNDHVQIPDPQREGWNFAGWYEDATFARPFDAEHTAITDDLWLYAKWDEIVEENNDVSYTVPGEGGYEATFLEEPDHVFSLMVTDIMQLTDEELAAFNITREAYNAVEEALADKVKNDGKLLAFYDITIEDENEEPIGEKEVIIKIPLTPEMKKYNTFKLIYVDIDNELNITVERKIALDVKGDYLVGKLPHLSNYVLVGSVTNNPKTLDNIYVWVITLLISMVGLVYGTISMKKTKTKKAK